MKLVIKILVSAIAVFITSYLLPGVVVSSIISAVIVAALLSLLNVTVKPLLVILTIPVTVITLGLFLLVINAVIILLASYFINGFHVDGFWSALIFSIILSIITSLLGFFVKDKK